MVVRITKLICFGIISFMVLVTTLALAGNQWLDAVPPQNVALAETTLQWDANTEEDLAGYFVYWARTGGDSPCQATDYMDVGDVNSVTFSTLGVSENIGLIFWVTAYDTSNNESKPSGIVQDFWYCPGDLNRDGVVDMQDWNIFGQYWGADDCNYCE